MQRAHLRATHPTLVVAITIAALGAVAALPALMSAPAIAPSAPAILKNQLGAPDDVIKLVPPAPPEEAYPAGPTILEPRLDSVPVKPTVAPGAPADGPAPGSTTGTSEARPGTADANARPVKLGPGHMELIEDEVQPQLTQTRRLPPTRRGLTE